MSDRTQTCKVGFSLLGFLSKIFSSHTCGKSHCYWICKVSTTSFSNDNQKSFTSNQLVNSYCLNSTDYCTHFTRMASPENNYNIIRIGWFLENWNFGTLFYIKSKKGNITWHKRRFLSTSEFPPRFHFFQLEVFFQIKARSFLNGKKLLPFMNWKKPEFKKDHGQNDSSCFMPTDT